MIVTTDGRTFCAALWKASDNCLAKVVPFAAASGERRRDEVGDFAGRCESGGGQPGHFWVPDFT